VAQQSSLDAISGAWDIDVLMTEAPTARFDGTADGRHVFWFDVLPDKRVRFVWDGVPGEPFNLIEQQDGSLVTLGAADCRIAYYAERDGRFFVGVDGEEQGPYDGITRSVPPTFSASGRHVAYGVYIGDRPAVVLDGVPQGSWRVAPVPPVFSPDETRFAFVAENQELRKGDSLAGYRQWIVVDGVEQPAVDGISVTPGGIQFTVDGRLVYGAIEAGQLRWVLDGVAGPPMLDAQVPTFSPDGRRFAYAEKLDRGTAMVVDGQRGPTFEAAGVPVFSPDSRRLAYLAVPARRQCVAVIDGVKGPVHHDAWGTIAFSPDSQRTAYLALEGGSGLLGRFRTTGRAVVDLVESTEAWDGFSSDPHFSPDSRHVAFSATRRKRQVVVVDDVAGPPFDLVGPPRYGSTGRLAYLAKSGRSYSVVLDGRPGAASEEPWVLAPNEFFMISPDGEHVASVGRVTSGWRPIVDDRIGPAYAGVGRVRFDDGRASFLAVRPDGVYRVSTVLGA